ncbi:GNAT family N-acetyltransferase [Microbacterium gorillae]|uniref:GNAT family N-acetyltransferase n=1 Tax=Microbacterium gorillae TaxID=1231063 RepID=UPI00058B7135|nr:GNAT family N-acetyltransferase [Microbacterium gorillae]
MRVRRIRADEWRQVRDLRLQALADPDASMAFIGSREVAAGQPDDHWRARAMAGAAGGPSAQFIALTGRVWQGTATVIVQEAGSLDERLRPRPERRATVVGVFVVPQARGGGAVDGLLGQCARWATEAGFRRLFLSVHVDNVRAQAAYRRFGFRDTGVEFTSVVGDEKEMAFEL